LPPTTSYTRTELFIRLLIPIYAIALFTPTIINELGYSAANAQLLSVPPFVAGCIATILVGVYSDKCNLRGPFIIVGAFVSMVGYILLYCDGRAGPSYVGACLCAIGIFPTIAVDLAWVSSNAGGDLKRGVAIAMVIGIGNLGGYVILLQMHNIRSLSPTLVFARPSFTLIHRVSTSDMALS
jgi:MFS family permease